jgi:hypothetical protein
MSLLEELAARSGCDYLSDLKSNENLKKIILATDIYKYDLNEWNDAVKYLTQDDSVSACIEDAVKRLLDCDTCQIL